MKKNFNFQKRAIALKCTQIYFQKSLTSKISLSWMETPLNKSYYLYWKSFAFNTCGFWGVKYFENCVRDFLILSILLVLHQLRG